MSRKGSREGWWGLSQGVESFLDQIITWRELGFNNAYHNEDHNKFESIPEWAKKTLAEHSDDERVYTHLSKLKMLRPTMKYGMLHKINLSRPGLSIITSECCGVSEYWNGNRHLKRQQTG